MDTQEHLNQEDEMSHVPLEELTAQLKQEQLRAMEATTDQYQVFFSRYRKAMILQDELLAVLRSTKAWMAALDVTSDQKQRQFLKVCEAIQKAEEGQS